MEGRPRRQYVSALVPHSTALIAALLIATAAADSALLGYDSSLMGSLNVMPTYLSYFALTTATKSLNTGISYVGGCCSSLLAGYVTDWRGRRETIIWSCAITFVGAILQAFAQNVGMFIAGRFIVGFGLGFAAVATPTYVAETIPPKHRAFALGSILLLLGSWDPYRVWYMLQGISQYIPSDWAWRIPSLTQIFWSIFCAVIVLFIPESPRWLVGHDRHAEALEVLAIVNAGGDVNDPVVQLQYREITDTITFEKNEGRQLTLAEAFSGSANRKRSFLAATFSAVVMLPGTNIITYYFGTMLDQAGITDPTTQLEINVILTAWTLVVSVISSWYADAVGRKMLCSLSLIGQIITFYLFAGLTKLYGESNNRSGIYGTIAMIFLYNGAYGYGVTPLSALYPPEILSYRIRATGMGLYTFTTKASGLFVTFVMPFALNAIGWKTYIINASFDILMLIGVILFWVETRGMTLEEVDRVFDGVKHSDVPNLEDLHRDISDSIPKIVGLDPSGRDVSREDVVHVNVIGTKEN